MTAHYTGATYDEDIDEVRFYIEFADDEANDHRAEFSVPPEVADELALSIAETIPDERKADMIDARRER